MLNLAQSQDIYSNYYSDPDYNYSDPNPCNECIDNFFTCFIKAEKSNQFIQCRDFEPELTLNCPVGLVWDQNSESCQSPFSKTFTRNRKTTPKCPVNLTFSEGMQACVTPINKRLYSESKAGTFVLNLDSQDGQICQKCATTENPSRSDYYSCYLPSSISKSKSNEFYECNHGELKILKCEKNKVFDEYLQRCVSEIRYSGRNHHERTSAETEQNNKTKRAIEKSRTMIGDSCRHCSISSTSNHKGNCFLTNTQSNTYVSCHVKSRQRNHLNFCDENLEWDQQIQACIHKNSLSQLKSRVVTVNEGILPDECSKDRCESSSCFLTRLIDEHTKQTSKLSENYVECYKGLTIPRTCSFNKVFDPIKSYCIDDPDASAGNKNDLFSLDYYYKFLSEY